MAMYGPEASVRRGETVAVRQSQIPDALAALEGVVAELENTVSLLEDRLNASGILQVDSKIAKDEATPKNILVPMSERINNSVNNVSALLAKINTLISRLEV